MIDARGEIADQGKAIECQRGPVNGDVLHLVLRHLHRRDVLDLDSIGRWVDGDAPRIMSAMALVIVPGLVPSSPCLQTSRLGGCTVTLR
jgi:hypothetical protein